MDIRNIDHPTEVDCTIFYTAKNVGKMFWDRSHSRWPYTKKEGGISPGTDSLDPPVAVMG